jgi:hypothetical protein
VILICGTNALDSVFSSIIVMLFSGFGNFSNVSDTLNTICPYFKLYYILPVTRSSFVKFIVPLYGFTSVRKHSNPSGD